MSKRSLSIIATLIGVAAMSVASAAPTAFSKTLCGGWDFGNSGQAGNSPILKLNGAASAGTAYTDVCDGDEDGSYTWTVRHGKVNTDTSKGNEHGTFTYKSGPATLGGIFNGAIAVFNPVTCTEAEEEQDNIVYQSSGRFNTLKQNSNRTGSDSTFHANGTYIVTVTADKTADDEDGPAECHVAVTLTGMQNQN